MPGASLVITDLHRRFGDRVALDGLGLDVPPGEVVGLLGPNGSGKTTAMRTVFGVVRPDSGTVTYGGRPLDAAIRRRFGYMPEERGLYPQMRVAEQVTYFGRLFGMSARDAGAAAAGLLDRLGLADRAGDSLESLSLGNQQRVQLAVALVHEPEALILDEPFSGLDPVAVDDLSHIIRDAATGGRTVLFSSHQLDLVEGICDSVRIIDAGRLVLEGRVADLQRDSGRRTLRIAVDDPAAVEAVGGAGWQRAPGGMLRRPLAASEDPLEVLQPVRAATRVTDLAVEAPSLSELFLDAVGRAEDAH
ncbi:MAG: ATP-binding cassette domain-containing protein, partial [Miltoncostaeaceae bacterium]